MEILTEDGLILFKFIKEHYENLTPDDAHEMIWMKIKNLLKPMFEADSLKISQYNYLRYVHNSKLNLVDKCILKTIIYYSYQNRSFPGFANFTFLETEKEDEIDAITWGNCWLYSYIALKMFDFNTVCCSYYQIYYPILYIRLLSEHPEAENMSFIQFFNSLVKETPELTQIKQTDLKEWIDSNVKPGDILFVSDSEEKCFHAWPVLKCGLLLEINQSCLMNSELLSEKPSLKKLDTLKVGKIHLV